MLRGYLYPFFLLATLLGWPLTFLDTLHVLADKLPQPGALG